MKTAEDLPKFLLQLGSPQDILYVHVGQRLLKVLAECGNLSSDLHQRLLTSHYYELLYRGVAASSLEVQDQRIDRPRRNAPTSSATEFSPVDIVLVVRGLARGDVAHRVAVAPAQCAGRGRDRPHIERVVAVDVAVRSPGEALTVCDPPCRRAGSWTLCDRAPDRPILEHVLADAFVG